MLSVLVAVVAAVVMFWIGLTILRALARPLPPPPPPGEMRKVDYRYRCTVCGAEVRMTLASEDIPDPPRHCLEDMQLVAPIE